MILAVDVGNTNTVLGVYEGDKLICEARIWTDRYKMADQYAIEFSGVLQLHGCPPDRFDAAIVSSVVPPLQPIIRSALLRLLDCRVLTVSPGIKTGLNIKIDNPATLGSDFVCASVSAIKKYGVPGIIIDLGTATKISAVDKFGSFIGCSIMPGIGVSLDALSSRAAQLPYIEFNAAQEIIGTNTIDSMRSGIVFGTASMLDGMIRKYRSVIGDEAKVVATGGYAGVIIPFCENEVILDEHLVLDGLYHIYKKNEDAL